MYDLIIKYYCLSDDLVTSDVDHDASTAYGWSFIISLLGDEVDWLLVCFQQL